MPHIRNKVTRVHILGNTQSGFPDVFEVALCCCNFVKATSIISGNPQTSKLHPRINIFRTLYVRILYLNSQRLSFDFSNLLGARLFTQLTRSSGQGVARLTNWETITSVFLSITLSLPLSPFISFISPYTKL